MKFFKSFTAIFITLSVLISLSVFPTYAESTSEEVNLTKEVHILTALGIISDNEEDYSRTVKRTEFADAIAKMMTETFANYTPIFDLTAKDEGMQWLYSMNKIDGSGENTFSPQSAIIVSEAVKMALSVLGYDELAKVQGGYPEGYRSVAYKQDLLDGVDCSFSDELTYKNFIELLYNILDVDVMEIVSIQSGGLVEYKEAKGKKILEKYRYIYKSEGLVTANDVSGLYSADDTVLKGHIEINSDILDASEIYNICCDMLGYNVEYWYKENDDEKKSLICITPEDNEILTLDSDEVVSYTNGTYAYETKNGRIKRESLNSETIILYNGEYIVNNIVFNPAHGTVELIDNDEDGKTDVLKIRDKKHVIVENVSNVNDMISVYDKFDYNYNFSVNASDPESYKVYNNNGNPVSLSDIVSGQVLEVEETASGNHKRITVVFDSKTGKIDSKSDTDIDFEGEEYAITARFDELLKQKHIKIDFNKVYVMYFSSNGSVVYISEDIASGNLLTHRVGYLHQVRIVSDITDDYLIRVLDQGGTWETFPLADRVSIDGNTVKRSNIDISGKTGGLVKYFVNIHGEVTEMFFPVEIPANPASTQMNEEFQEIYKNEKASYRYYNGGNVFGDEYDSIVQCPNDAIIFTRPQQMTSLNSENGVFNRECISVVPKSFIKLDKTYSLTAYSTDGTPGILDACILGVDDTNGAIIYEKDRPMVVNDIRMVLNEDEEVCYQVTGLLDGADKVFNIEDKRKDTTAPLPFGPGDVIQFHVNHEGKYVIYDNKGDFTYGWKLLCDYTKNGGLKPYTNRTSFIDNFPAPKVSDGNYRVKYGTVYDVEGTNIFINASEDVNNWKTVEAIDNRFGRVYVWDEDGQKFRNGSNLDAICSKYSLGDASKAYVLNYNQYLIIVLYPAESVSNAGN